MDCAESDNQRRLGLVMLGQPQMQEEPRPGPNSDDVESDESASNRYLIGPGVGWVVESKGVLVRNADGNRFLDYPQAAVWDLFSRGYRFAQVVSMVAAIVSVDHETSRTIVTKAVDDWMGCGFLTKAERRG